MGLKERSHFKNSFMDWCIENDRRDLIERWDDSINAVNPSEVGRSSNLSYYFTCPRGLHESRLYKIDGITRYNQKVLCDECESIAQWGIDNIGADFIPQYWDRSSKLDPWQVRKSSREIISIKCENHDYHGYYQLPAYAYIGGNRCPYCAGKKVHVLDSLESIHPEVNMIWGDTNEKSPREYSPRSGKFVYWKCLNGHGEYQRSIYQSVRYDFRCPMCSFEQSESRLQSQVKGYLNDKVFYKINHEHYCTIVPINPKNHRNLPFDNEVEDLKLIIEVHGEQHYNIRSIWIRKNQNKEQQLIEFNKRKLYDRYKKYVAFCNGYHYLEIPYWTEYDESYKILIDNEIAKILNSKEVA